MIDSLTTIIEPSTFQTFSMWTRVNLMPVLMVMNLIMSWVVFGVMVKSRGWKSEISSAYGYAAVAWSLCVGMI